MCRIRKIVMEDFKKVVEAGRNWQCRLEIWSDSAGQRAYGGMAYFWIWKNGGLSFWLYKNLCDQFYWYLSECCAEIFQRPGPFQKNDRLIIGKAFIEIAKGYGMTIRPCAEGTELAPYGADCSGCMTVKTFETVLHTHLDVPKRKENQRNGQCACFLGVDIGAYDTCGHLCRYCYANANADW